MLRILHLRSSSGLWGGERQILQLAQPLVRHGIHMGLCVLSRGDAGRPLAEAARRLGIEVELLRADARFPLVAIAVIARRLREGHFDVLHTHEYKGDLLSLLAARRAGVPIVASVRGYTQRTLPLRLYRYLDLFALRHFDRVLPVSEYLRSELLAAGLNAEAIITVYDGLDLATFRNQTTTAQGLRTRLGLNRAFVVTIVGRLSSEKGQRDFLAAARFVLDQLHNVRFLVVGEGPDHAALQAQAMAIGRSGTILFLGYREDVPALMMASDVVILASHREAFGDVLIEAMAASRPVVATRVGGVPEIVRDGEAGLLVPPRNPACLAQAIIYLLTHPEEARRMGQRGCAVVAKHFTIQRVAEQLANIYQEVLGERR